MKIRKMKDWDFVSVSMFFIIAGSILLVSGVYMLVLPELNPGKFGDAITITIGGILTIMVSYVHLELVLTRKMLKK